jgi:hypothetical protein
MASVLSKCEQIELVPQRQRRLEAPRDKGWARRVAGLGGGTKLTSHGQRKPKEILGRTETVRSRSTADGRRAKTSGRTSPYPVPNGFWVAV